MTDSGSPTPNSNPLQAMLIKGMAGAVAIAGTTAIPILVQQWLQPPAPQPAQSVTAPQTITPEPTQSVTAPQTVTPQSALNQGMPIEVMPAEVMPSEVLPVDLPVMTTDDDDDDDGDDDDDAPRRRQEEGKGRGKKD
ncbi:MAG: hypothetical protein ICV77_03525 [Cyanobacteria bacterium Co-bin8]|nr:hypothetical protein [Cyanobacteria bacterium Co-bin8]